MQEEGVGAPFLCERVRVGEVIHTQPHFIERAPKNILFFKNQKGID